MKRPYTIALTGGIASGKSTVSALFTTLGAEVIDADQVARDVVAPGTTGLASVVAAFGTEVLAADGELDRAGMRARIFSDAAARARLEALLHPLIRSELLQRRDCSPAPYVVLAVPIYSRLALTAEVDRVLVVDASPEHQLQRLLARDGNDPVLAERMIAAQEPREERLALAHDVIANNGSPAGLGTQVAALHRQYLQLAGQPGQ